MQKSNPLEPDNFPWDLRVVTGYQCPICFREYISPGWCPQRLMGAENAVQPHPQVTLRPIFPDNHEKH